ncbi:MAG: hypothetical protein ACFB4J_10195 [Elainellaceae cyanobacterium]
MHHLKPSPALRWMLAHPLLMWVGAWSCTMVLCWLGLALLLHPSVVVLSLHRENPISVIEPKPVYTPLTQPINPKAAARRESREFSIVPVLGLAMACIVGSRMMMGRMRSNY